MDKTRKAFTFTVKHKLDASQISKYDSIFWLTGGEGKKSYLALGNLSETETSDNQNWEALAQFQDNLNDWCFGWLNYDLKNELEQLTSENTPVFNNPKLKFIQPELVFEWENETIICHYFPEQNNIAEIHELVDLLWSAPSNEILGKPTAIDLKARITKTEYLQHIEHIKQHIQIGDIYEANFCQQYIATGEIDPYLTFKKLSDISPTPFGTFVKYKEFYTMGASPERFIKRKGQQLISEPIKGTAKRGRTKEEDTQLKAELKQSEKDITENVMIVDLTRNDLSKTAKKGSVKVTELCGIYTFPQVHQMISTIESTIENGITNTEILKSIFPMPSMTGVPKIKALEIIDQQESFQRELFSGSIGFIKPNGDFDFNVVIRTLFYNKKQQSISYAVGGAITADSDPEKEYEESLLKAKAIRSLFQ